MFNSKSKQIKSLQLRVDELETYVENKKDEEWNLQYPNGELKSIFGSLVWFYRRYTGVILLENNNIYDAKINKIENINDTAVKLTILHRYNQNYKYAKDYISSFIVDKSNGNVIKVSREKY